MALQTSDGPETRNITDGLASGFTPCAVQPAREGFDSLGLSGFKANQGSALLRESIELMKSCPRDESYLRGHDWLVDELESLLQLARGAKA